MKESHKFFIGIASLLLLYVASYCALRLTKYFVRQEFLSIGCSQDIRNRYRDDTGPMREGYITHSFESDRNQIGCGRIQKDQPRYGEAALRLIFYPLGELEMRLRGFNSSTMYVIQNVAEFDFYYSSKKAHYYQRQTLVDEFPVSRNGQISK